MRHLRGAVDEGITMAREAIKDLLERGEESPTEEGLLEYTLTDDPDGRKK